MTLSQSLEKLSQDSRLKRLFSPNDVDTCALYLWLLEIKTGKKSREYRLLYGWVIPRSSGRASQWSSFNSLPKWPVPPYQFRIHTLNFYHNGNVIFNLTKQLCEGMTLGEACEQIGILQPDEQFKQFRLAISVQKISQSFTIRPVIFLETSFSSLPIIYQLKPPTSSIDGVSAFVGSLFRLDKLDLFCQSNGDKLPKVDELATKCLSHLQVETGLDFCNADSQRLGNLEWLCFPAANQEEQSQVNIKTNSTHNQVEVEILPNILPTGMDVLIRCRAKNGGVIVLDECQVNQIYDQAITSVSFQAQEQINSVIVTIWIQKLDSTTWEIWYEHSTLTQCQLNLNLGVSSPQINLPSNWLKEFAKSRIKERVDKAQKFNQVNYEGLQIGGENVDPWILASQKIRYFSRLLFPSQSDGYFFKKGWVENEPEPGRLSFFEWLQKLSNDPTASKVLIIDPFFDTPGIEELIARVSAVQAEYVVLTNTQVKSHDDSSPTGNNQPQITGKNQEPQRATRLKNACYQFQVLLKNIKFKLLDVRSKKGGDNQIFHDRYILIFNQNCDVKVGYHLSNSIQGATKSYPLLITPIPEDVIPLVNDYIADLLEPANDKPTEVIEIFSSVHQRTISRDSNRPTGLDSISNANLFFAALLQDVNLAFLNQTDLGNHLQNHGLYDISTYDFDISETNLNQIKTSLTKFTQTLLTADTDFFAKLWVGLGAWLDHSSKAEEYLAIINNIGGAALAAKLETFLSQVSNHLNLLTTSYEASIQEDAIQLSQFIQQDFVNAIQDADRLLKFTDCRGWQTCLQDFGIRYATQALIALEPAQLVRVITGFWQLLTDTSSLDNSQFWSVIYSLSFTFQEMLLQLIIIRFFHKEDNVLVEQLLKSDVPSLQAIAAYSLSPLWNTDDNEKDSDLNNSFKLLINLTEIERIYTLTEWIYNLRIRANVIQGETELLRELRLAIFEKIRQFFPNNLSLDELKIIHRRLSGPCQENWVKSTNEDLLQSLVDDDKLNIDEVTELWLSILESILHNWLDTYLPNSIKNSIKQNEEQYPIPTPNFYENSELIEVCAWAIAHASSDCREKWLRKIETLNSIAQRVIYRPYLRSQNYEAWNKANICLSCLQKLTQVLYQFHKIE
ncbi:VPA1262 family protein [Anabaena sp. PCC 7938]|uniref:VPA1262 family protein n=1 Tax=Anabaena sp. PCC 7938 TaxID=1296340 RepID=UPI0012372462|nr:VPA1262 family protein [Anabaena sp. CCAP 1446/1C]